MESSDTSKGPLKTFLSGSRIGIFLGGWYAVAAIILRHGLSADAFLTIDFLTLFVVGCLVGFIFGGAWEVLAEVILRRYYSSRSAKQGSFTRASFLVEGVVRFGLPLGIYLAIATTFAKPGISMDPLLWLEFLLSLVIYLAGSIPVGCVFGLFMFGFVKMFGPPVAGSSD